MIRMKYFRLKDVFDRKKVLHGTFRGEFRGGVDGVRDGIRQFDRVVDTCRRRGRHRLMNRSLGRIRFGESSRRGDEEMKREVGARRLGVVTCFES